MKLLLMIGLLNLGDLKDTILASNQRDTIWLENMTIKEFKHRLHIIETGNLKNPYQAVNQYGYLGKYQISRDYLNKYGRTSIDNFLQNAWAQEVTMNRLICHYLNAISRLKLDTYLGKEINGICITLEGLLAGYHQHPLALKKFLHSDGQIDLTDGNGTPVSKYLRLCINN